MEATRSKLQGELTRTKRTQKDLADEIGVHNSIISKILSGSIKPSLEVAVHIESATGGVVRAVDWVASKQ